MWFASGIASGSPNPPASSAGVKPPGQLEQRQRVAACLADDPVAHPLVERSADRRVEQRAGVAVTQATDEQLRKPGHLALLAGLAHREDQGNRFRQQTPRDERERLRRRPILPLRIIDHADERPLVGHEGQQPEDREADQEAVGRPLCAQAERHAERVALWTGETLAAVEERCAQLMQTGERKLHLGLDARGSRDAASRRALHQVVQQHGLADTRLATHHEHATPTGPHTRHQGVQRLALVVPTEQRRPEIGPRHT
jgi:hypothetical protein